jgi:hypothetical protein
MMRKDADMMPRPLAMTMLLGVLIGGAFWAGLLVLVVR